MKTANAVLGFEIEISEEEKEIGVNKVTENLHQKGKDFCIEKQVWTGGCHTFYSPKRWAERGEEYGTDSLLVIVHDGGDLSVYSSDLLYSLSSAFGEGYLIEHCTGWYSAVYES